MNSRYFFFGSAMLALMAGAYYVGRTHAPAQSAVAEPAIDHDAATSGKEKAVGKRSPVMVKPTAVAERGAPLPPLGTPLKDAFAELQARANSGDAAAATRLFHDLGRCSRLHGAEWKNAHATDDLTNRKTDGMSAEQLRTYQILLDAMELRQQGVQKSQELCAGVGDEMLDTLVPNIQQAAQLGDADARACYLGSGPIYDARSLLDHPESLASYRSSARSMIDAGLAAGDWRTVDLLQNAYEPGAQSLLAGVVGPDPYQHYRYLKLYRLGAESFRIPSLDQQLISAAANLMPAQLADADEWAQTTFQRNFSGNSTSATPQGWNACAFSEN